MKKVLVCSNYSLSSEEREKIKGIMQESECPNESLKNTFPERYKGIDEDVINFDVGVERSVRTEIQY